MATPATPPLLLGFNLEHPLVRPPRKACLEVIPGSPWVTPRGAPWPLPGSDPQDGLSLCRPQVSPRSPSGVGSDPQDGMGENFTSPT